MLFISKIIKSFRRTVFISSLYLKNRIGGIFNPTLIAVCTGLLASLVVWRINGNYFSSYLPQEPSFFFGSAAFVGGALAIIVTLNTLLIQNALDKLPARSFKTATSSKWLYAMYIIMATISVLLFILGLTYIDINHIARTHFLRFGIGLNLWALVIIFIYSQLIASRMNPSEQIKRIHKLIKRKIDKVEKLIKRAGKILAQGETPVAAVEAGVRNQLQPTFRSIIDDLADLGGMYKRLLQRGDDELAMACLTSITASVSYVYGTRKDNAIAIPSQEYGFFSPKSDLADFSNRVDEILMPLWIEALQSNNVVAIREILTGYTNMTVSSITMKHTNYNRDNPLLGFTWGGFKRVFEKGLESKNAEALFQLSSAVTTIAKYYYLNAPKGNTNYLHFKGFIDTEFKLYVYAVAKTDSTLLSQVSDGYMGLLGVVLTVDKGDSEIDKVMIEKFADMLALANLPQIERIPTAGDEIYAQDLLINAHISGITATSTTTKRIRLFIRATNILLGTLSAAAAKSTPNVARINFSNYFQYSGQVALTLIQDTPSGLRANDVTKLENILKQLIALHETSFMSFDYANSNESEDYSNKISIIGQTAANINDSSNAKKFIDSLMKMATWLIENHAGASRDTIYITYRLVLQAAYIAGISHAHRRYNVSSYYKRLLHRLEDLWIQKVFPDGIPVTPVIPSPNIFRGMFDDAISGFSSSGIPGITEYPEGVFMEFVDRRAVEAFNEYLWRDKAVADPVNHPHEPSHYFLGF